MPTILMLLCLLLVVVISICAALIVQAMHRINGILRNSKGEDGSDSEDEDNGGGGGGWDEPGPPPSGGDYDRDLHEQFHAVADAVGETIEAEEREKVCAYSIRSVYGNSEGSHSS